MLISTGNLLRSLSAVTGNGVRISDRWNNRSGRNTIGQHGDGAIGGSPKFINRPRVASRFVTGWTIDAERNFATPKTDVWISFDAKVHDDALVVGQAATGHTISIGGVAQTTNYNGGSGTGSWEFRIPVAFTQASAITYSYDQGAGNTLNVMDGTELSTITGQAVENYLTKRIRFVLNKSDGTVCNAETVKLAVFTYAAGSASSGSWMVRQQGQTATTDANGQIDVPYAGSASVGDTVYVMVIRTDGSPSESLAWTNVVT